MPSRSLCTLTTLAIILVIGLLGCSGGSGGPIMPGVSGTDMEISAPGQAQSQLEYDTGNRFIWGLYLMHVNEDHSEITVEPIRDAAMHLNVTGYLERPGANFLKIQTVSWSEYDTLLVDIRLDHPLGSNKSLTGFDVRGIAILPEVKLFPSTTFTVYDGPNDGELQQIYASRWLLNADGYTTLWNRETSDEIAHPQIFGYIRGRFATPSEYFIEANLHGYKQFYTDEIRRAFTPNNGAVRQYEFDFPPGPLTFAYAVDVSWEEPLNKPVVNYDVDFPITANSAEPYQISATITANSLTKIGGSADLQFDVMDWQDATTFSHVHVEAPDLFYGTIDLTAVGPVSYPDANTARYEVTVPNTKGNAITTNGGSDLLVVVEDVDNSVVNPDLTAYNIFKIPVTDVPGFWRDRGGDNSWVNVPLAAPLIEPSSVSTGQPDLAIVSYPEDECDFYNGGPEIMLFDDNDSRFIVYNRNLNTTFPKAGYPFDYPPSWLLYPHCMDATNIGWMGVGSDNSTSVGGNYQVKHIVNIMDQCGLYGYSWHSGTDPEGYTETIRDVTAGMGNVTGDPIYSLHVYDAGTLPDRAHILSVGDPYTDPGAANTFRTWLPMAAAAGVPGSIDHNAERLRTGIDTNPVGLPPIHWAYYVVESYPTTNISEIEAYDINFMNFDPVPLWNLTDLQIKSEFPGAWAVDCEVVPSYTQHTQIIGDEYAQYNWLAVLMTDGTDYWVAFYDVLNPVPDNGTNDPHMSIYMSTKHPLPSTGEVVALDFDHQFFEAYVLVRDSSDDYFITIFEYFY